MYMSTTYAIIHIHHHVCVIHFEMGVYTSFLLFGYVTLSGDVVYIGKVLSVTSHQKVLLSTSPRNNIFLMKPCNVTIFKRITNGTSCLNYILPFFKVIRNNTTYLSDVHCYSSYDTFPNRCTSHVYAERKHKAY
jgi:hypothetical protein